MKKYLTTRDLPTSYLEGIGRIGVKWAYLENRLSTIVFLLLGIDIKQGRIAVRKSDTKERLNMVEELMSLKGHAIEHVDLKNLRIALEELAKSRNLFAHGIWFIKEDIFHVQDVTGKWTPAESGKSVKRATKPTGLAVMETDLNVLATKIEKAIEDIEVLHNEIVVAMAAQNPRK